MHHGLVHADPEVQAGDNDQWLIFEVTDTGCGISQHALSSLFTEYVQVCHDNICTHFAMQRQCHHMHACCVPLQQRKALYLQAVIFCKHPNRATTVTVVQHRLNLHQSTIIEGRWTQSVAVLHIDRPHAPWLSPTEALTSLLLSSSAGRESLTRTPMSQAPTMCLLDPLL